jgi:hypothetical protein
VGAGFPTVSCSIRSVEFRVACNGDDRSAPMNYTCLEVVIDKTELHNNKTVYQTLLKRTHRTLPYQIYCEGTALIMFTIAPIAGTCSN